jgi:tetratricopeptide (TPR) repeat protein
MKRRRFYRFITIALLVVPVAACASKGITEGNFSQVSPTFFSDAITKADELFRQRDDLAKLREAVQTLGRTRNPDVRNYEVEWKFAKYNYFLGKHSTDEKEIEKAFEDGVQAGKIAAKIEPTKPDGHFWYGANLGEQAKRSPVTVGIKSIDDIRAAMNKVIEIQPDYESASAYVALGQVELKAGMLGGGKPEKAVEYLEKALQLEKTNTYIYLNLAEAYLAVGRDAEAKKNLEYLLKMKPNPEYMFEYKETTERAKKLLETRF